VEFGTKMLVPSDDGIEGGILRKVRYTKFQTQLILKIKIEF
jgi:hypothetical protein